MLRNLILLILFSLSPISLGSAMAEDAHFSQFFGKYEGRTEPLGLAGVEKRDLSVEVSEAERGFALTWTTIIERPDGEVKKRTATIVFRPAQRENMFYSVGRKDMFGNKIPIDPLKGDPYFWARIKDQTLIVNGLIITDEGGYEVQTYYRTLTETGLELRFTRFRDGKGLKDIEASLKRVD